MRRALLGLWSYAEFFAALLVFLPVMGVVALLHSRDPGRRTRGQWMRRFGRVASRLTPIWRFSVEGRGPADVRHRPYVVVANHESTADPFLLSFLPWDMRWVAKAELFRQPLTGWLLALGGDIPVRRGQGDSVREMMAACRKTLAAGVPVMIFPEGTRSPDGSLLPFRDGAFSLAVAAGVPVLPVALAGTRSCRPKGSVWFGEARAVARVLEPIPTAGLGPADVPALREQVRARIAAAAAELQVRLGLPVARAPAHPALEVLHPAAASGRGDVAGTAAHG